MNLRDGAGALAARQVRQMAYKQGHLLSRFHASKDNSFDNKLGDTFYATCLFCNQVIIINFSPFDEQEEARFPIHTATSKRFDSLFEVRYMVFGIKKCASVL